MATSGPSDYQNKAIPERIVTITDCTRTRAVDNVMGGPIVDTNVVIPDKVNLVIGKARIDHSFLFMENRRMSAGRLQNGGGVGVWLDRTTQSSVRVKKWGLVPSGGKLSPFYPLLKLSAFLACFLRGNDRDRDREGKREIGHVGPILFCA